MTLKEWRTLVGVGSSVSAGPTSKCATGCAFAVSF
jgi:hypothetical protein